MILYPAIDLKEGKCVRLKQGSFNNVKVYNDNALEIAEEFKSYGAEYIHVVDLDGARTGASVNLEIIKEIVRKTGLKVETGGGIRSLEAVKERLECGIDSIIIGTMAVKKPETVKQAVEAYGPERIIVGLDGFSGKAATEGWEEKSTRDIIELALMYKDMGLERIVYTEISRDGMLNGPDVAYTEKLIKTTGMKITASGGVSCSTDLEELEKIGAYGAIIGKAFYEGKINLKEEFLKRK